MDHKDDTEFGRYLAAQANSLETPLGKAADAYAQGIIERITKSIANGDLDNTLQGDLELMKAEFLDAVQPGQSVGQDGTFTKMDEDQHLVWGWANVNTMFGDPVIDRQNDIIDMPELQKAAHAFISDRTSGEMHKYVGKDPKKVGEIVESMVFDNDLQKALGINLGREGWLIGVKVSDENTWDRIKKGELKAFSIGGKGVRKAWTDEARAASAAARAASKKAKSSNLPRDHEAAQQLQDEASRHYPVGSPEFKEHATARNAHTDFFESHFPNGADASDTVPRDENGKIKFPDSAFRDNEEERGKLSRIIDEDDEDAAREWYGKSFTKAWSDAAREASAAARAASKEANAASKEANAQTKGTGKYSDKHLEAALAHHDAAKVYEKEAPDQPFNTGKIGTHQRARDEHLDKANPYNRKDQNHMNAAWYEGAQPDRTPGFMNSKADTIKDIQYGHRISTANTQKTGEMADAYDEGKAARQALRNGSGYIGKTWTDEARAASAAARRMASHPTIRFAQAGDLSERAIALGDRAHRDNTVAAHNKAADLHGKAASIQANVGGGPDSDGLAEWHDEQAGYHEAAAIDLKRHPAYMDSVQGAYTRHARPQMENGPERSLVTGQPLPKPIPGQYSNERSLVTGQRLPKFGKFADPDNELYPIGKEEEIRASWTELMKLDVPDETITKRIITEWQHVIDKHGPSDLGKRLATLTKVWSDAARKASAEARKASANAEKNPSPEAHHVAADAHEKAANMYNKGIREGNGSKSELARDDHDDEAFFHRNQAAKLQLAQDRKQGTK